MVFKKREEVTEGQLLRDALRHKDTKIAVTSPDGRRWTFCNDTASECKLRVLDINVTESGNKMDILTGFVVKAVNGRLG